jgi:hypothetical protein
MQEIEQQQQQQQPKQPEHHEDEKNILIDSLGRIARKLRISVGTLAANNN